MNTDLALFPSSFKYHPSFPILVSEINDISRHEALFVKNPYVLDNLIRASLAFTLCFYGNLLSSLYWLLQRKYMKHPFAIDKDNSLLHLFLALADGELATDNIPSKNGVACPHFVPMLEAAQFANINTLTIETLVNRLDSHSSLDMVMKDLKLCSALQSYLSFSFNCTRTFDDSFATIAIRELTLPRNFNVIISNLSSDIKYDKYRFFLEKHVDLDEGEHSALMLEALESVSDVGRYINTMVEFYRLRLMVYDACLESDPIFL